MFYVGIDIAKTKHDLACMNETGETVSTNFRFANSYQGFHQLKIKLEQLSPITQDVQFALESTGHYNYNIVAFLREIGYNVFAYNPFIIKQFAKSQSLRKTKTDTKDTLLIARKLRSDVTPDYYQTDKVMDELKHTKISSEEISDGREYSLLFLCVKVVVSCKVVASFSARRRVLKMTSLK